MPVERKARIIPTCSGRCGYDACFPCMWVWYVLSFPYFSTPKNVPHWMSAASGRKKKHINCMDMPLKTSSSPQSTLVSSSGTTWNEASISTPSPTKPTRPPVQPQDRQREDKGNCAQSPCSTDNWVSVWDPHTENEISSIKKVQRRAVWWVTHRHRQTSCVNSVMDSLQWPTLQQRRRKARLKMSFKFHHGLIFISSSYICRGQQAADVARGRTITAMTSPPAGHSTGGCRSSLELYQTGISASGDRGGWHPGLL